MDEEETCVIDPNAMYTLQKAAYLADLCYHSIWRSIQRGKLEAAKFGGVWCIKGCHLAAFLDARNKEKGR